MSMKPFVNRYPQSMNPTWTDALKLTANTAIRYKLPANTERIFITGKDDFWVKCGTTDVEAKIPTSHVVDGSASFYCPGQLDGLSEVTHVSIISDVDSVVCVSSWEK